MVGQAPHHCQEAVEDTHAHAHTPWSMYKPQEELRPMDKSMLEQVQPKRDSGLWRTPTRAGKRVRRREQQRETSLS